MSYEDDTQPRTYHDPNEDPLLAELDVSIPKVPTELAAAALQDAEPLSEPVHSLTYEEKLALDKKKMSALGRKLKADPDVELSQADVTFLYGLAADAEQRPESEARNEKVDEIVRQRNTARDMATAFGTEDPDQIIDALLKRDRTDLILTGFDNLPTRVAEHMVATGKEDTLIYDPRAIQKFNNLSAGFARLLYERSQGFTPRLLVEHTDHFSPDAQEVFVENEVANARPWNIVRKFDSLQLPDKQSAAERLFADPRALSGIGENPKAFLPYIDGHELAQRLIDTGRVDIIANHRAAYEGLLPDTLTPELLEYASHEYARTNIAQKSPDWYKDEEGRFGPRRTQLDKRLASLRR